MFYLVHMSSSRPANNTSRGKWKLIVLHKVMARGALCRKLGGAEEVVNTAWRGEVVEAGGAVGVDTPGWPWRGRCRSHRGPLATRVNTDDFSVWPYELTLLGETQEVGLEQWQCQER